MDNNIIINELLCWVINMINVLNCSQIMQYSLEKYAESEIKTARDILYNLVITDKEQPEFGKRLKHETGDSKSTKLMKEIYRICQEYPVITKELVIVARDFSKLPLIEWYSIRISKVGITSRNIQGM